MLRTRVSRCRSAVVLSVLILLPGCMVGDDGSYDGVIFTSNQTGNGAPSGPHYDLNLIGVPKAKSPDLTGGDGHRIFVPLDGTTRINLSEGDFAVLDANATDGVGAFQLPNPDPLNTGFTTYSVFARALGKPGGSSVTTACATDPTTGDVVCSDQSMVLVRGTGGSK